MEINDRKPKVLYVDDEEDNLHVFKSSLRRHYDIITAKSAKDGLDLLKDNPVDLVISDQRMPLMNGVEFLSSLPDEPHNIRMIMTGYSDIETVIHALNTGKIQKYIKKPWEKEELKQVLDDALAKFSIKGFDKNKIELEQKEQTEALVHVEESNLRTINKAQAEEIKMLKEQVNEAYQNVQLLSEIGQEISSTLDIETILNTVYENVNQLMDASSFGIGIYNDANSTIDYQMAIEKGKRYKPYSRTMEDKNQFPVWCIENKKEVFVNDVYKEYSRYISYFEKDEVGILEDSTLAPQTLSFIYIPLLIKDRIIGLITVQSYEKNAYNTYHLSALRNIAIFVATALENSKAFHVIEKQKTEIEHKNTNLEHEVEKRTQELRIQKDELEETFSKLKLLTEIGQEITSTLNLDDILYAVYENVNRIMDASVFGIGIYHPETKIIDIRLAIENGKRYQPYQRTMEDKNQFPVWCIENKKEIFINDVYKEYSRYIPQHKEKAPMLEDSSHASDPLSLIYIPLLFNNDPIGILTVQSFRKFVYNPYHLDILRSLASYITTAIQNARSYSKMTEAFEQLKSAQSKLVEAEKMASLGVLTAGIAHEINNPVNFISAGIGSLKENYADLKKLLELIEHPDPEKSTDDLWKHIREFQNEIELKSMIEEIEVLINTIQNGAKRTSEIVKGLRNFTRLDENEMKIANLEEGIDSTLVILGNQVKNRVEIIKNYGNLPEILCYPGQLNQVFMNIL
ncbi:MAG: GAF domain-containing protein, partial [Bacteroidota bacterium]|nr:GAF domain-containing protein [Bacteroidota bacterium]